MYTFFIQTYIDCLHIKKTDKSRLHVEDTMDIDNSNASKSTEEDFLSDKVFFSTHTFLQWCVLDCWYFLVAKSFFYVFCCILANPLLFGTAG